MSSLKVQEQRTFRPSSQVFYRKLDTALPEIVRGEGPYLFDTQGKRYLDACGGAMVCSIGHGVAEIAEAVGAQARTLAYVNGTAFTNEPAERLADLLATKTPSGVGQAYFLSSGSEATEAALKLARQYHLERGESQRQTIVAQTPGYHGNTLLALAASARGHYRTMFGPWLTEVVMIPAPYPYRQTNVQDGSALEAAILRAGPENVAAFIAEPVGGSSTGASLPQPSYFTRIREICDRYGVLFICDEVLTGAGRTGTYFALEHCSGDRIVPDIITMGKGLNAGYAPLSAVLVKDSIVETIANGSGNFMHAQTYSHNPLACAAGLAVQRYIERHDLIARAARTGAQLGERLQQWKAQLPKDSSAAQVGDVRGIGMLWAVEFVGDPETKAPLPRSLHFAEKFTARAKENGLVVWPNVGHADGTNGDLIMIAPPFVIESSHIDEIVDKLNTTFEEVRI